jgi:hypothetical protein
MYEMLSDGERPFDDIENFVEHLEMEGKPEFSVETPSQL